MHHVLEHRRNVGKKEALFKVGKKRGVWDFFKFTEIAQFFMETKEGDEQGIGRDTFKENGWYLVAINFPPMWYEMFALSLTIVPHRRENSYERIKKNPVKSMGLVVYICKLYL